MKTIYLNGEQLATKCWCCDGTGQIAITFDEEGEPLKTVECGECNGYGGHLTDSGGAILTLIKEYGNK